MIKEKLEKTYKLENELYNLYNEQSWCKMIKASKVEFLAFHDKIIEEEDAIVLIYYDIVLASNLKNTFDKDYYNLLKQDLNILIDFVLRYIKSILELISNTITINNSLEFFRKRYNMFDDAILNDNHYFNELFGDLFRQNGILDELYFKLPNELRDEELAVLLYKKLTPRELAIVYYINNLDYGIDRSFEGNFKTDQIFLELYNRKSEDIINFLTDIVKIPCSYVIGAIGALINLSYRYSHQELTVLIQNIGFSDDFDNKLLDGLGIIDNLYNCLLLAEDIKLKIGDIKDFDVYDKSLYYYYRDYYNRKRIY